MVCLGNICRSPLAEGIMKHAVKEANLDWDVGSAGTGNWHIGKAPDKRSIREAKTRGIDISQQVCRQFKVQDFDEFDLILVMDKNNLSDVLSLARNQHHRDKVKLLLNDKEVPDPYFNDDHFSPVFDLIEVGCKDIIRAYSL